MTKSTKVDPDAMQIDAISKGKGKGKDQSKHGKAKPKAKGKANAKKTGSNGS